jgi:inositol transport system substrate-binding protein
MIGAIFMKDIYILLTKSKTWVSKMIGLTTDDFYTHAAISFDKNLTPCYGFSRKYAYSPLPANIQKEYLDDTFHRKQKNIPCAVYKITVEDDVYEKVKESVEKVFKNRRHYSFNIIGLILCRCGIAYKRKNKYFCSQFVSSVLYENGVIHLTKDPSLVRPNDFTGFEELKCVYEGKLNILREKLSLAN